VKFWGIHIQDRCTSSDLYLHRNIHRAMTNEPSGSGNGDWKGRTVLTRWLKFIKWDLSQQLPTSFICSV
jgi:hypothetical protein